MAYLSMQKGPALASRAAWAAMDGSSSGSRPPWPSQPRRTARHHRPAHTDTPPHTEDQDQDEDEEDEEGEEDEDEDEEP